MNSSSLSPLQKQFEELVEGLFRTQFASGVFIAVLAVITTVGNGLLILAIWRDPLKSFRTPTTFFVLGLAAADLLTGIIACPLYAYMFIAIHFMKSAGNKSMLSAINTAANIGQKVSNITMNSSYIILLLFTWSQFTAINFPHKHRSIITKKRVIVSVVLTWVYSVGFVMLSFLGVPELMLQRVDLYFNTTLSLVLLVVAYACLYRAFRRQMRRLQPFNTNNNTAGKQRRSGNRRERQFTVVNLLLVMFVIICTLPSTVIFYLYFHWKPAILNYVKLMIGSLISSDILLLKMALDPIIYAWRLPQYRRALKALLSCRNQRNQVEELFSFTTNNLNAARSRGRVHSPNQEPTNLRLTITEHCRTLDITVA